VTLEIHKPEDQRYVKSLIFSPAGHGKTFLLGTAQEDPRTAPMLLLDFEGGEETLAGLDIDVARIRSWEDYNEAFELVSDENCPYKSLGIDSISETHIWGLLTRIDEKGPSRKEPDLIEQGDYGVVSTQMRRLLREFRDLPMHVFYTAGSKEIEVRKEGKVRVPSMAGQLAEEVVHLMSVVGYLAKGEDEDGDEFRSLLLQNWGGFRTKVRTKWRAVAPDEIEDPDITKLLDVLEVPMPRGRKKSTSTKEKE
jgi:AAA domain